jgi:hypothetical protein
LDQEQAITDQELAPPAPEFSTSDLANYVRKNWSQAYQHASTVQTRLLANLRNFNSIYEPAKLAEIRKMVGSEVFIPLTATKVNAAVAWLMDIYFNPAGDKPWDLDSTPIPELPLSTEEEIRGEVLNEVMQVVVQYARMTQQDPLQLMNKYKPQILDRVFFKLREVSQDAIEDLKRAIDDQLTEGGFYPELKRCIMDVVIYEFSCLKGPIYRKEKYFKRILNPMTGTYSNSIEEKTKPVYERRSPFNIFIEPGSEHVNNGYVFDLLSYKLKDLYDMIGLEGFKEEEIREVIQRYKDGRLTEWTNSLTDIKNEKSRSTLSTYEPKDTVDILEFWGSINGQYLLDWGMTEFDIEDPDKYYDVCVWLVGEVVIKAMLNPDPMGRKPFHITSYIKNNDAVVGGKGLSTLLEAFQLICNAIARAIVNNAAISSGPLVEYNEDRMAPGYDPVLYPWKTFPSTGGAMSDSPAVRFYQAQPVSEQLLRVYDYFSKLADQYSIPSYAHGDTKVGGGGDTASGLSMLMNSADRVIKNVVKNFDELIASGIELLYLYNMSFNEEAFDYIGDVRIVARGSAALLQKEQQQVRRTEFLQMTNNPVDLQILGQEVRRELLLEVANSLNLESVTKKFPIVDEIDELKLEIEKIMVNAQAQIASQQNAAGGPPPKGPQTLDQAGNPASGQETRLVTQEQAPQQRAEIA